MKTIMRWVILALVIGLVWEHGVAGTVLGTVGQKCYPITFSGSNQGSTISVYGVWIEKIDRVTAPAGVSVSIEGKFNGDQNNSGPFSGKGRVDLRIKTNDATPGKKTISLINDPPFGDTFTFTITIVAFPTVTSVDVPTPADPFTQITVTLNGTGLQKAKDWASGIIVHQNLIPLITVGSGGSVVSSVRVLSSSSTSIQAKIFFYALIQDATVDLFFGSDNDCVPLGLSPLKKRVRVKTAAV